MIYHECSACGAHLDPGERCDCERKDRWSVEAQMKDGIPVYTTETGRREDIVRRYKDLGARTLIMIPCEGGVSV